MLSLLFVSVAIWASCESSFQTLASRLQQLGYEKSVVNRLLATDPKLAEKIANHPLGAPLILNGSNKVYRGLSTDPSLLNTKYVSPKYKDEVWFGADTTAQLYMIPKPLAVVLELQIPKMFVQQSSSLEGKYSRFDIPDDAPFISRVGIEGMPGTRGWVTWFEFEDVPNPVNPPMYALHDCRTKNAQAVHSNCTP